MTLDQLIKQLADISLMQSQVITSLHVERWPIGVVAQQHKCSVSRIQYEEAAGFRNMVAILLGGDGFDKAHQKHLDWIEAQQKKSEKKKAVAKAAAVGKKMQR